MLAYIIRRLLLIIPTVFLVSLLTFFSVKMIPGSVVDIMLYQHESDPLITREYIEHSLGLDVPIPTQYGQWISNILLHGDLGNSLWKNTPVTEEVLARLPVTFELGIFSLLLGLIIALPVGIYSALRQDSVVDYIARSFSILAIAVPGFWLGTMIMVFPSIWWGWAPSVEYIPFNQNPLENLKIFIIPSLIMGGALSGLTMRMLRTMVLEVTRQDYVRTAWAKGLNERVVVMRHILKNAMIPVITIIGLQVPVLIGGAVIIENIFVLPGMGRLMMQAISSRDYPIISGVMLLLTVFVLLANLIVDVTYGYLDPRIRIK